MSFRNFLLEKTANSYKREINKDEILDILKTNCKNADLTNPLWRGMRGSADSYIFKGNEGTRKSINNSNHYTIIIDHYIKKENANNPIRGASVVVASNGAKSHASNFGPDMYAVFLYDNSVAGCIDSHDMWDLKFKYNDVRLSLPRLNSMMVDNNISDSSYEQTKKDLIHYINDDNNSDDLLYKAISGDVEKFLVDVYHNNLGIKFLNSSQTAKLPKESLNELWIGDKCIAIKESVYNEIMKEIKK